jgi:chemotaxis family two-component system sensor kinase Cph1
MTEGQQRHVGHRRRTSTIAPAQPGVDIWDVHPEQLTRVDDVPHGHHGFAVYDTPIDQFVTLVAFIRGGLAQGDRCLYVYEDVPLKDIRHALRGGGIDVRHEEERGALVLLPPRAYVPAGSSPEVAIETVARRVENAVADGFAGLHVAVSTTWMATSAFGVDWERRFEALLATPRLSLLAISLLCLINRRHLPTDMLVASCQLHAWIALGDQVQANVFYEPPGQVVELASPANRGAWMLYQLTRLHASQRALVIRDRPFVVLVAPSPVPIAQLGADRWF